MERDFRKRDGGGIRKEIDDGGGSQKGSVGQLADRAMRRVVVGRRFFGGAMAVGVSVVARGAGMAGVAGGHMEGRGEHERPDEERRRQTVPPFDHMPINILRPARYRNRINKAGAGAPAVVNPPGWRG